MTTTVTSRFLKTFLFFSLFSFVLIFLVREFFLDDFSKYGSSKHIAILLSVFLSYISVFPYIFSFSLYRGFFYYRYNGESNILDVSQKAIIVCATIFVIYFCILTFFSSKIFQTIYNIYVSQEYITLFQSKEERALEFLNEARTAFNEKDYDKSIDIVEEALLLMPDDQDLIMFLRNVRRQQSIDNLVVVSDAASALEAKYMVEAVEAYSVLNYQKSKKLLMMVLDINSQNGMAKFYLNKIALDLGEENSLFTQKSQEEIFIYNKMSEAISLYNIKNYWQAYQVLRDIYLKYPDNYEVFDYYQLVISKIKIDDFFINEAEFLYETFVKPSDEISTTQSTKSDIFNIFSFPINQELVAPIEFFKILNNTYMYTTVVDIFNDIYFFDTVIISNDDGANSYTKYRFGKLLENKDTGRHYILLKGQYNADGTYSENDMLHHNISIAATKNLFTTAKYIDITDFISISNVFTLLKEMPSFGYAESDILYMLMHKMFLPFEVLLIAVIVAYYSMRYRAKNKVHIFHKFIGFLGSMILTFLILEVFDLIISILSSASSRNYLAFIILAIATIIFILVYSIQFFRVKIDAT